MERYGHVIFLIAAVIGALVFACSRAGTTSPDFSVKLYFSVFCPPEIVFAALPERKAACRR
jgi:hypothetical protein